ncbi:MAG: hypothetical protein WCS37_04650 [Chloroflexota bacterium]
MKLGFIPIGARGGSVMEFLNPSLKLVLRADGYGYQTVPFIITIC